MIQVKMTEETYDYLKDMVVGAIKGDMLHEKTLEWDDLTKTAYAALFDLTARSDKLERAD